MLRTLDAPHRDGLADRNAAVAYARVTDADIVDAVCDEDEVTCGRVRDGGLYTLKSRTPRRSAPRVVGARGIDVPDRRDTRANSRKARRRNIHRVIVVGRDDPVGVADVAVAHVHIRECQTGDPVRNGLTYPRVGLNADDAVTHHAAPGRRLPSQSDAVRLIGGSVDVLHPRPLVPAERGRSLESPHVDHAIFDARTSRQIRGETIRTVQSRIKARRSGLLPIVSRSRQQKLGRFLRVARSVCQGVGAGIGDVAIEVGSLIEVGQCTGRVPVFPENAIDERRVECPADVAANVIQNRTVDKLPTARTTAVSARAVSRDRAIHREATVHSTAFARSPVVRNPTVLHLGLVGPATTTVARIISDK